MKKMLVNQMFRNAILTIPLLFAFLLSFGCGGVAQNPTQPAFNPPGQAGGTTGQPGAGGDEEGGLLDRITGGVADTGEQVISGSFEILWPQGLSAMEEGQLMLAGQYFKSAFAQDPQSGDAAFAYALVDLMRDYRRFAVFLHPGVDRLFMNTPLIGHPELFPNPFLADDSYVLRLAALGHRASKVNPTVQYPIIGPIDSNMMFTPEHFSHLKAVIQTEIPPQPPGVHGEDDGTTSIIDPTGNAPNGGTGTMTPDGSTTTPPTQWAQYDSYAKNETIGKQRDVFSGPGDPAGMSGTSEGGVPPAPGTPPVGAPGGPLPERAEPIDEDEWERWISDYRVTAARDGADMFISKQFYSGIKLLQEEIKEQITNLEAVRTIIEAEGYSLNLPLNVLDGTKKITLQFDVDDYHLLLNHYKLIDVILSYALAYNNSVQIFLPTGVSDDKDEDNILTPKEYLPPAPFGTLDDESAQKLGSLHSNFVQTLMSLNTVLTPLLTEGKAVQPGEAEPKRLFFLSSFHRNFVTIDEWNTHIRSIADKSSSGTAVKIASGPGAGEIVAVYDALFKSPIRDIRDPLPSFDLTTRDVVLDEEENWSTDPTFGGFFIEGLTDSETFIVSGRLSCVVYSDDMSKAAKHRVMIGAGNGEVGDNGVATVANVSINKLIGTPYIINDPDGEEVGTGVVRTLSEVLVLFDAQILLNMLQPGGMGTHMTTPGGGMVIGPEGVGIIPGTGETGTGTTENGEEEEETDDEDEEEQKPPEYQPNPPGVGGAGLAP